MPSLLSICFPKKRHTVAFVANRMNPLRTPSIAVSCCGLNALALCLLTPSPRKNHPCFQLGGQTAKFVEWVYPTQVAHTTSWPLNQASSRKRPLREYLQMQAKRQESAPAKVGSVQSYMRKNQKWMRRDSSRQVHLVPLEGLEPPTVSLGRNCSSIELQRLA